MEKEIRIDLHEYQDIFLFSQAKFPAMASAIGTGKTYMLLLKVWLYCKEYKGTNALIVRKEFTDLKDCFDDRTDILTDNGWMKFEDLTGEESVLSLNPDTEEAEYRPIQKVITQEYEGDMFEVDTRSRNFCITPNHKMLIKRPSSKNGEKSKTANWEFKKIEDIDTSFLLKRDCDWKGEEIETIEINPSAKYYTTHLGNRGQIKTAKAYRFGMDDWLEFLGWFISEGCTYKHKTKKTWWVTIAQSDKQNPDKVEQIRECLKRLGLPTTLYSGERFTLGSRAIAEHLNLHCGQGAENKQVPDYVKNLSPRQIKIFLNSYNKGDGHTLKDGTRRFNTASKQLADDIQELIIKSGGYATVSIRDNRGRKSWIEDHYATTKHLDYLVIEYSSKHTSLDTLVKQEEIRKKSYKGKIYCITTEPYHTIYTRRNGRCMWSGNSTMRDFETYFSVKIGSDKNYVFPNGSKIMFRHAAEIDVLKNINLAIAAIEQAEEFEDDTQFQFIRDRLRQQNGAAVRPLCVIANAKGHNWVWNLWVQKAKAKEIDKDTGQYLYKKGEYECITANTFANAINLPDDFIRDCRAKEEEAPSHYRQFVLNSFEETGIDDAVFEFRNLEWARKTDHRFQQGYGLRICGFDIARYGNDKCAAVAIEQLGALHWRVCYVDQWEKKDLDYTTGRILSTVKDIGSLLNIIDEDGLGSGPFDTITKGRGRNDFRGFRNPSYSYKDNKDYGNPRTANTFKLKGMILKGHIGLENEELIQELSTLRFRFLNDGRKILISKEQMRKEGIASPNLADSLIYATSLVGEVRYDQDNLFNRQPQYYKEESLL